MLNIGPSGSWHVNLEDTSLTAAQRLKGNFTTQYGIMKGYWKKINETRCHVLIKKYSSLPPRPHPMEELPNMGLFGHHCFCCSVAQSCRTLCNPMDCRMLGFPVFHYLPECGQTHDYWVGDAIQLSHPLLSPFFSCPQSFPASRTFPVSWLFASGGQSIGASASSSLLAMNI